ncbi:hypothetical protein ACFFSY_21030 [Paenibacillus aurantiacus]|uniref:Uncharacterized protein n=1 Tax=Paenibacillus aurantiacus TaxID=1936118 RepID=A0ABV5KVJ0_9BACL
MDQEGKVLVIDQMDLRNIRYLTASRNQSLLTALISEADVHAINLEGVDEVRIVPDRLEREHELLRDNIRITLHRYQSSKSEWTTAAH